MKIQTLFPVGLVALIIVFFSSCSNVSLTSWKNPKDNQQISKVFVWGMFQKLEYERPFEDAVVQYFASKGLSAIPALNVLNPTMKYEHAQLEHIIDSLGADAILIFAYKGTQKEQNYVPPSTTFYPDYYGNYYGYYNWYYPYYGPGYEVMTTGGYWTTTTVVNLTANLYGNSDDQLIWTAQVAVTDPNYIDAAGTDIARSIYQDWLKNNILKFK